MSGLWGLRGRKKITASEVRELPEGARVRVHGRDRQGYSTELDCVVVRTKRGVGLAYSDYYGGRTVMSIRALDGAVHYYSIPEETKP